jgi:hypothetical protein
MLAKLRPFRSVIVLISFAAIVASGCAANRPAGGGGAAQAPTPSTMPGVIDPGADPSADGTAPASTTPGAGTGTASIRTRAEQDAAISTAVSYLRREVGMSDPVASNFRWTGARTARVDARARIHDGGQTFAKGPLTVVSLQRLRTVWYVTGTRTDGIRVAKPGYLAKVGSPVTVSGRARAFEGNVKVVVTQDRYGKDIELGSGNVLGRGDALGPFKGSIPFLLPTARTGSVMFIEPSAIDGSALDVTVVRIRFAHHANPLADRVSDPKLAADRLVAAWVAGDKKAAAKVATQPVVTKLFSADRPATDPKPGSCHLAKLGAFQCVYPMPPGSPLTLTVEGGASVGWLVSGFSFEG